jgi:hypothetical protein
MIAALARCVPLAHNERQWNEREREEQRMAQQQNVGMALSH